ncbi:MAG: hypothetical protein HRT88_02810 [Lentisphaeraceae bacterium]|nr:hypothetical protein [Lentisphaeraceae bacterium]
MLKPLALAVAFVLSVNADTDCHVQLREGVIVRLEKHSSAKIRELNKEGESEVIIRHAQDGKEFAIIIITLDKGHSLGIYDYQLIAEIAENTHNALGISLDKRNIYQRKIWEAKVSTGNTTLWKALQDNRTASDKKGVKPLSGKSTIGLLFEVPSGNRFKLISRLYDKNLQKKYELKEILDFDKMEKTPGKSKQSKQ